MIEATIAAAQARLAAAMRSRIEAILREQLLRPSPTPLQRVNALIDSVSPDTPPHRGFTVHPELLAILKQSQRPSARDHLTNSITISGFQLFPTP